MDGYTRVHIDNSGDIYTHFPTFRQTFRGRLSLCFKIFPHDFQNVFFGIFNPLQVRNRRGVNGTVGQKVGRCGNGKRFSKCEKF